MAIISVDAKESRQIEIVWDVNVAVVATIIGLVVDFIVDFVAIWILWTIIYNVASGTTTVAGNNFVVIVVVFGIVGPFIVVVKKGRFVG